MDPQGMTTSYVKGINRQVIYRYLYEHRQASRQELTQALHMSLTTVTQNLKALEEHGLVHKDGQLASTGGRKPSIYTIHETVRISIGTSLFQNHIQMAAIDLYGMPLYKADFPLPYENSDSYCQKAGQAIQDFIAASGFPAGSILGVGIAIQGIVSRDGTRVHYGELMGNTGFEVSRLAAHIPFPCRLEHDSKAAAYTELWNRPETKDALVVLLNPNLGSALIINGQIHEGLHMHSGTIEHLCMDPHGKACYCGRHGCLETLCSADSLMLESGRSIDCFFRDLRNGDDTCKAIWDNWLNHMAFALNNINTLIDCRIILSGCLSSYISTEDVAQVFHRMQELSAFPLEQNFIVCRQDGKYATAIGAGLYYISQFLKTGIDIWQ